MPIELSPKEHQAHKESKRRSLEIERLRASRGTGDAMEKNLTLEEIDRAQEAARKREETRPYGE